MAITIDWPTKVINVPRNDMLLIQSVPTEIRELNLDAFRLELKSIESSIEGMPFLDTHSHNPPVTVGGVTLARVVEIINGYTVTFEDGQYAVNLVGANSNVGDVTNVNQVSVRSSNSAGLTYSKEIEDQSFLEARVWIDPTKGLTGTQFPRGTPGSPVNNIVDAEQIIINRGLPDRIHLNGTLIVPNGFDFPDTDILGTSPTVSFIIINNGQNINGSTLRKITITGNPSGYFTMEDGVITDVSNFIGDASNSGIGGTITLPSGPSQNTLYTLHNCFSLVPGTGTPILDCNNATNLQLQVRGYSGGLEIRNFTDPNSNISVDLLSGHLKLDSTCTAGNIVVRGTGRFTDNSAGSIITENVTPVFSTAEKDATLTTLSSISDIVTLLQKYEENRSVIDKINNTLTIYDDDGTTPILRFSLLDSGGSPSTIEVAERLPLP